MKQVSNRHLIGFAAVVLVALIAVYWNHFDNSFHFDDSHTIVSNSFIREIGNVPLFFQDARTTSTLPPNQAYRPMVTTLNAIDFWLGKSLNPKTFHWHIFLEFILLLILFYFLLIRIFEKVDSNKHRLVALLATAFFAFHTATAETINYVIARSDGFSTLMVVAGMLIQISTNGWKKNLGLIPFLLGCLAKPTALMLAPLLFLYELFLEQPSVLVQKEKIRWNGKLIRLFRRTGAYFLLGFFAYFFTQSMASETWVRNTVASPIEYLNTQLYVIALYVKVFFLPAHLSADPDLQLISEFFTAQTLGGLLVISMLLVMAFCFGKKRETLPISFGILWFFVALLPSSSIVPLADVMNHHRTFFPYLGLTMALSWSVFLVWRRFSVKQSNQMARIAFGVGIFSVFALHAFGTYERNEVWHNEESLWKDVAEKSPNNGRGLMAYGLQLLEKGDTGGALKYLEKASRTSFGKHPYLVVNLARCYAADGQNQRAKQYFELSLTGGDNFPECHYHYAIWLAEQGELQAAHVQISDLLRVSPSHADARRIKDALEAEMTKRAEQKSNRETAEKYVALSLQYYQAGRFQECVEMCEKAVAVQPDYADAYNNMCSAYNKLSQYELAVLACEKALAIKPDFELAKNNLKWSRYQLNK